MNVSEFQKLMRSLVRPTTTLLMTGALIVFTYFEQVGVGAMPDKFSTAALMILAFWFGGRLLNGEAKK